MRGVPKSGFYPSCPRGNCHYAFGGVIIVSYYDNGSNPFGTATTCNCEDAWQWCAPFGA
jgi:hypothetical protein